MASEISDDKLTIKNILFTKALPNYIIPIATEGYKVFSCTDCGDRFLLESSYNHHINRQSLKITYLCRHCGKVVIFYNRCKLLSHIRSHAFKTATIFVSDLKIEPLPIENINWVIANKPEVINTTKITKKNNVCFECNEVINPVGTVCNARSKHYMRYTDKVYTCPICLFTVPNACTLSAHLRIHLRIPPFFCPECGTKLSSHHIIYPYHHDCEGFKMIRATTRVLCRQNGCNKIFHPNVYKEHIRSHVKKVYKCTVCSASSLCLNKRPIGKHLPCDHGDAKIVKLFVCPFCPNKIKGKYVDAHLNKHIKSIMEQNNNKMIDQIYLCKSCSNTFNNVYSFLKHHVNAHGACKKFFSKFLNETSKGKSKGMYRVVKRCDKCLRSFTYRCELENIKILPNECPYKCSTTSIKDNRQNVLIRATENKIVCSLCKNKISDNWKNVKVHFALCHKSIKCLDLKLTLHKIERRNYLKSRVIKRKNLQNITDVTKNKLKNNKINMSHENREKDFVTESGDQHAGSCIKKICKICNFNSEDNETFEKHIITHRDPCMAYQCLECGQCFMVKPSFSTHLLLEHGISDINKQRCYNELALSKQLNNSSIEDEPLQENQCTICRDQFDNPNDLEKHFRVHGMAFLMKNKNNSP